eukprot:TRINITY_DN62987_c0_g1_i1.p1 TRINITY_DN62987_c0_g1~~TRINITY_DN62987_c0_g1_i1.p1  ORF type:complete len:644 (+),score=108.41 TRINITY_DN62987_c0_g1_i1:268-1932(+)
MTPMPSIGVTRKGSKVGQPFQLVEVGPLSSLPPAARSATPSPVVPLLRSDLRTPGSMRPAPDPVSAKRSGGTEEADEPLPAAAVDGAQENWGADATWGGDGSDWWQQRNWRRRPGGRRRRGGGGGWRDRGDDGGPHEEGPDEHGFDARTFVGEWLDGLGHSILVVPAARKQGQGRYRDAYLATMHKPGVPDKVFHISRDQGKKDWTCGNGVLNRESTTSEKIVWLAGDGRTNAWNRRPPDGPVYFDAPPAPPEGEEGMCAWDCAPPPWMIQPAGGEAGTEFFMLPDPAAPLEGETAGDGAVAAEGEPRIARGTLNADAPEFKMSGVLSPLRTSPAVTPAAAPAAAATGPGGLNAGARAFVPSPAAVPSATPKVGPVASSATPKVGPVASATPKVGPVSSVPPSPAVPVAAAPSQDPALRISLTLSEDWPDVKLENNRLEWTLPDAWGKLSRFPKDFCITSPMFGLPRAPTMQLVFYPSGSKAAEANTCTVALTRGPDSAGMKFEFLVNGRSSGPKVCLGRRYLGDYPRPFADSDESKTERVVITMLVHDVFGDP